MPLSAVLELQLGLTKLALAVYPERQAYVDSCFELCDELIVKTGRVSDPTCVSLLSKLAKLPLESYDDVLVALDLAAWPKLCSHLDDAQRKAVATLLLTRVSEQGAVIADVAKTDQLLTFVAPVLTDPPGASPSEEEVDEDLPIEMAPLSHTLHALHHADTDAHGRVLNAVYRHATLPAVTARRSPYALVPLVFQCLALARRIKLVTDAGEQPQVSCHKLLGFTSRMIEAITPLSPKLAFRLYIQCGQTADACGEDAICYELLTQSFVIYEEELPDSRAQGAAATLAAATLPTLTCFSDEQYETLATTLTQYSAKQLKKPDQARAVAKASYLFWPMGEAAEPLKSGKRVLECLQRALKISDACKVSNMHTALFVEVLEGYLWHYDQANELVTATYITSLMQLIEQHLEEEAAAAALRQRYAAIRAHLTYKATRGGDERYAALIA